MRAKIQPCECEDSQNIPSPTFFNVGSIDVLDTYVGIAIPIVSEDLL